MNSDAVIPKTDHQYPGTERDQNVRCQLWRSFAGKLAWTTWLMAVNVVCGWCLGGIYGCNRTKFGRSRSGPRLRVAPSTSGAAQWAINRRSDVVRLGCIGRLGLASALTISMA